LRYDGHIWQQLQSPTNLILTDVCCAEDGNVYACGQAGTLLRGRNDTWDVIDHGATTEDFWSVVWIHGALYLSTMLGIFVLRDDALQMINMGDDHASTYYHLSAADDVLWSIGAKDLMAFDGTTWSRVD
jgi:hypothetical protein